MPLSIDQPLHNISDRGSLISGFSIQFARRHGDTRPVHKGTSTVACAVCDFGQAEHISNFSSASDTNLSMIMSLRINLFVFSALFGIIGSSQEGTNPELQHIGKVLGSFLAKGQLFVENLPLISLKILTLNETTVPILGNIARLLLCAIATLWLDQKKSRHAVLERCLSLAICLSILGACSILQPRLQTDFMWSGRCIADLLLFIAVWSELNTTAEPATFQSIIRRCDCLLVSSSLLGCNIFDLITASLIIFLLQTLSFFNSTELCHKSDVRIQLLLCD